MNGLVTLALVQSLINILVREGVLSDENGQRVYTETIDVLNEVETHSEAEAKLVAETIAHINRLMNEM